MGWRRSLRSTRNCFIELFARDRDLTSAPGLRKTGQAMDNWPYDDRKCPARTKQQGVASKGAKSSRDEGTLHVVEANDDGKQSVGWKFSQAVAAEGMCS